MNSAAGAAVAQEIGAELGINVVQHDCARLRFAPSPTGFQHDPRVFTHHLEPPFNMSNVDLGKLP